MRIGPDTSTSMTSQRNNIVLGKCFENDEKFLLLIHDCSYCYILIICFIGSMTIIALQTENRSRALNMKVGKILHSGNS